MVLRKRSSARIRLERICLPGDASNFITHDGIQPGDIVVLCCRVSTRQQDRTGNLDTQESYLRAEVIAKGAIIVDVVSHVGSGFEPSKGRRVKILKRKFAESKWDLAFSISKTLRSSELGENQQPKHQETPL